MASISTTSFYGARARAQHERRHMPQSKINLSRSDVESKVNEDELEVFGEEESEVIMPVKQKVKTKQILMKNIQCNVMLQEPLVQKIQVKATYLCIGI